MLRRLTSVSPDLVFTTVVTLREQVRGRLVAVDQASEGDDLLLAYDRLLATVRYFAQVNVLPFTPAAAATLPGNTANLPTNKPAMAIAETAVTAC